MEVKVFQFGKYKVLVQFLGLDLPVWVENGPRVPKYGVVVTRDDLTVAYNCSAFGSINDAKQRKYDRHEEMAALVLRELTDAFFDRDEFLSLAGENPPLKQQAALLKCCRAANKMGDDSMQQIIEHLEEKGLL